MLDNFEKEYAKYEAKLTTPFDDVSMTEEEYTELECQLMDAGESLMEERWLEERSNDK